MSQMGNLEKLGILVIVILVVVVGVVVITPRQTLFPDLPDGEIAHTPDFLEPAPPDGVDGGAGADPLSPANLAQLPDPHTEPGTGGSPSEATPPVVSEPQFRDVVVQDDDTLERIARREMGAGSLWPEILKANPGLDPRKLRPKQTIRVPVASSSPSGGPAKDPLLARVPGPGSQPAPVAPLPGGRIYVVQRGDTLSDIAREQMGAASKVADLIAANQDVLQGTQTIRPGMKLRIPGARSSTGSVAPAPRGPGLDGGAKSYTVQRGDTLMSISARMLGSSKRWREIQLANESVLHGRNELQVGMVLTIPADVAAR